MRPVVVILQSLDKMPDHPNPNPLRAETTGTPHRHFSLADSDSDAAFAAYQRYVTSIKTPNCYLLAVDPTWSRFD